MLAVMVSLKQKLNMMINADNGMSHKTKKYAVKLDKELFQQRATWFMLSPIVKIGIYLYEPALRLFEEVYSAGTEPYLEVIKY